MKKKNAKRSFSLFDPHHVIERQTIWIGCSVGLLIGGVAVSQIHYNHVRYEQLMRVDQSGATSHFSKTQNTVLTLGKTHLSPDHKTAFIPLTFSSTDNVGINAKNYRFYVTAASGKAMTYKVRGNFIMYGTTGRGVLVLHSPTKIENQPLALFVINQKKVSTVDEANEDNTMDQASADTTEFGKYDVAPFKINPGAIDVAKHSRIDASAQQPLPIYEQLFGSGDIQKIYKAIDKDKSQIKKYNKAASALVERLKDAGYDVPKAPAWMAEDWQPEDAINLKTGKTRNGKNALTYKRQSTDSASSNNQYPTNLTNRDGTTTADATEQRQNEDSSSNSDANADSGNANSIGGTATDPATQWQNLQQAWNQVETLKINLYVTQYQRLYRSRHQNKSVLRQTTIGPGHAVVQKGKVEVKKK